MFLIAFIGQLWAQDREQPTHPIDALTLEEVQAAIDLLRKENLADDASRYPVMELYEPARRGVLSWKAGQYPNLSKPGQGLPVYNSDQQNIHNTDTVAWYTLGFRHITRPEDFPILPTRWHEFQLRPVHFFDRDPSAGLNIKQLPQK